MMALLIILSLVIVLTDSIRLSLMGWKATLPWSVVWMVVAYCSAMWLTGLSMEEISGYLNIRTVCLFGFIESLVFIFYLFYNGRGKALLSWYPGLMMVFPVALLAFWLTRIVSGWSFMAIGATAAGATLVVLLALTIFLQWLRSEKSWLYVASIVSLIIYISIYGIS